MVFSIVVITEAVIMLLQMVCPKYETDILVNNNVTDTSLTGQIRCRPAAFLEDATRVVSAGSKLFLTTGAWRQHEAVRRMVELVKLTTSSDA